MFNPFTRVTPINPSDVQSFEYKKEFRRYIYNIRYKNGHFHTGRASEIDITWILYRLGVRSIPY